MYFTFAMQQQCKPSATSPFLHHTEQSCCFFLLEFSDCSLSSPSEWSDSSFSSSASASTILLDEVPRKKPRVEGTINAASAKKVATKLSSHKFLKMSTFVLLFHSFWLLFFPLKLIEAVLGTSSGGEEVLEEYHTTQTLTDATRRKLVSIIVAHMIDKHG